MLRTTLSILAILSFAGCGSSSNLGAPAPNPSLENGVPTVTLNQGGGYSYFATIDEEGLAETEATLHPGLEVRSIPVRGNGTFTGRFDMDVVTDIAGAGAGSSGTEASISGPLTLDVDFQNQTVTSRDSDLDVAGTYDEHTLVGTVTYDGLEGDMTGGIGGRQAIGVFSREAADSIFAGGFYVNDAP